MLNFIVMLLEDLEKLNTLGHPQAVAEQGERSKLVKKG